MSINELYSKTCCGDVSAEEQLFQKLSVRFRYFALQRVWNKTDAEEVVQDSLLVIRKEYGNITFTTSFSAWAYKVLDNQIMAYIKTRKRQAKNVQSLEQRGGYPMQQKDINPDLKLRLRGCLKKIYGTNMRYARVLNLHYQGFDTDEICRKLTITATNLYATLSRARSLLEHCLEKGDIK